MSKRLRVCLGLMLAVPDVVVARGTDTIEETAYCLNLVVKSNKSVVLTAAAWQR